MRTLRGWSRWALGGLALSTFASFCTAAALGHRFEIIGRLIADASSVSEADADASDTTVAILSITSVILLVLSGIVFVGWLYVAAKTAQRLRPAALRHRPGWAIGGWFVPVLWWWRPMQMVYDIWAAGGPPEPRVTRSPLVGWWWGVFLVSSAAGTLGGDLSDNLTLQGLNDQTVVDILRQLLDSAAGVLAIFVVAIATGRLLRQTPDAALPLPPDPTQPPTTRAEDRGWETDPEFDARWERWSRGE